MTLMNFQGSWNRRLDDLRSHHKTTVFRRDSSVFSYGTGAWERYEAYSFFIFCFYPAQLVSIGPMECCIAMHEEASPYGKYLLTICIIRHRHFLPVGPWMVTSRTFPDQAVQIPQAASGNRPEAKTRSTLQRGFFSIAELTRASIPLF